MFRRMLMAMAVIAVVAAPANAQSWRGFYLGGALGGAWQADDAAERVEFDTNLDGAFTDSVRTAVGADAFSPGFCGGIATAPTPGGCTDDQNGLDFGGRVGYDWQSERMVFGLVGELSRPDLHDGVSAFSTTPARYAFDRSSDALMSLRARIGFGSERLMAFGTGGLAWGWIAQSFATSNTVNTFVPVNQDGDGDTQRASGWQYGGGVEFRLTGGLSLTGEYLFTSLDNRDESIVRAQGPAPATNPFILVNTSGTDLRRSQRFDHSSVRVGMNVRF